MLQTRDAAPAEGQGVAQSPTGGNGPLLGGRHRDHHGGRLTLDAWYRRARTPRPAVARDARPLGDPRLGGDAPPDAGGRVSPRSTTTSSPQFPTPTAMAAAGPAAVIAAWGRLGYPRRARRLWEAAVVIAEHGWPDDLTALPGVGRYTAGAVAAQADDADVPAVEVNVRRVRRAGARRAAHHHARPKRAMVEVGASAARPRPAARADGRRRGAVPAARAVVRGVPAASAVRDTRSARRREAVAAGAVRGQLPPAARDACWRGCATGPCPRPTSTPTRSRRWSTTASPSSTRRDGDACPDRRRDVRRESRGSCRGGRGRLR